mmetsp:Transcript_14459/g.46175  ORF Transcript_14459/g.46175 Transcript_14459/m.46175 type:complete len:259 (+) Transcript_14459:358-1134(+)
MWNSTSCTFTPMTTSLTLMVPGLEMNETRSLRQVKSGMKGGCGYMGAAKASDTEGTSTTRVGSSAASPWVPMICSSNTLTFNIISSFNVTSTRDPSPRGMRMLPSSMAGWLAGTNGPHRINTSGGTSASLHAATRSMSGWKSRLSVVVYGPVATHRLSALPPWYSMLWWNRFTSTAGVFGSGSRASVNSRRTTIVSPRVFSPSATTTWPGNRENSGNSRRSSLTRAPRESATEPSSSTEAGLRCPSAASHTMRPPTRT